MQNIKKSVFQEYADLNNQIKLLEAKKTLLANEIKKRMEVEEVTNYKNDYGIFSKMVRKNWQYSSTVEVLNEKLKKQKKIEELEGTANYTESISITFRANK